MMPSTILASLLALAILGAISASRIQEEQEVFEAVPTQLESPLDNVEVRYCITVLFATERLTFHRVTRKLGDFNYNLSIGAGIFLFYFYSYSFTFQT